MNIPGPSKFNNELEKPGSSHGLEGNSNLSLERSWCDEMGPAERRFKVIQGFLVGQVNDRESQRHLCMFGAQQIVRARAEIEQVARSDSRWV